MDLDVITMPKDQAAEQLAVYRQALEHHDDREYAAVARGLRWMRRDDVLGLIDLRAAITAGGVDGRGLPRMAVMQADEEWCYVRTDCRGQVTFQAVKWPAHNRVRGMYPFPEGTLPAHEQVPVKSRSGRFLYQRCRQSHGANLRAMVPMVPPQLRPAHHLRNYAVLWEVDRWERVPEPPGDPALLKHIGGDLYALLGTWDLTDLERAILAGRNRP